MNTATKAIAAKNITTNDALVDQHGCAVDVKSVIVDGNSVHVTVFSMYKKSGIEKLTFSANQKIRVVNFEWANQVGV
jgi:hypothetical protein